jgi:hypothetical protein
MSIAFIDVKAIFSDSSGVMGRYLVIRLDKKNGWQMMIESKEPARHVKSVQS